jgi:aspartyl-tRNA(Asn)/glutamyl-tRNA(Gln) amidotransferase subunit A
MTLRYWRDLSAILHQYAQMTFSNPIIEAGLAGLSQLYAERAVTPVEACEAYLSRISRLDPALGAYVHVEADTARAAAHRSAERWAKGEPLSPLDGAPIAVKANIAVEGAPWHAGIEAYRHRIAEGDATVVARLRDAGAVILGLTNMHEGAFGAVTDNPWFGRTHNPWRHDYSAGGSSGGSAAAVAAGLCAAALGSDTLGSVRIPSSLCGVFGHKPTQGLLPTDAVAPMSWTLDHVGVHGRSADDCARLLAGCCGAEPELAAEIAEPASLDSLRGATFAVLDLDGFDIDAAEKEAFVGLAGRAAGLGLELETLTLTPAVFAEMRRLGVFISAAESTAAHAEALAATPELFSEAYKGRMIEGERQSAAALARAYRELAELAADVRERLAPFAALLLPTTPMPAFPFTEAHKLTPGALTTLANGLGLPATAFPTGLSDDDLPLSGQALAWDDETSLGLARALAHPAGSPPSFRG